MRISTKGRGIIRAQQGAAKDADVSPYMKSDEFEVTIGNLREYQE